MRSDMDHTVLPANYTMPAFTPQPQNITALWLVLIYRPTEGRRLSLPGWLVTYRNKVPLPGVEPGHVTHPSTNRARRRVTSLIRPTPLSLRHATILLYKLVMKYVKLSLSLLSSSSPSPSLMLSIKRKFGSPSDVLNRQLTHNQYQ